MVFYLSFTLPRAIIFPLLSSVFHASKMNGKVKAEKPFGTHRNIHLLAVAGYTPSLLIFIFEAK
jgi:hypothetical protein